MASTIQIKRGTGSAVPSGLADGELAINLDNGRLYFGSGSTSVNSFTFQNLTAENYIVSTSVTNITTQTLSGSTQFGDSADDTHQFTGAITASGNISSSGNIYANRFSDFVEILTIGNGATIAVDSAAAVGNSTFGLAIDGTTKIQLNKDAVATEFFGNTIFDSPITASGAISSSGTITANSFAGAATSIANALTVDDVTLQLDSGTTFNGSAARTISVKDGGIDSDALAADLTLVSNDPFNGGSVTVKGTSSTGLKIFSSHAATSRDVGLNISASSNGQQYSLGLNRPNNSFVISPTNISTMADAGNPIFELDATGNMTASGNISSSGIITANSLVGTLSTAAQTNITSVGTLGSLTVSGDITANGNIVGDGATQLSGLTNITAIGNMALGNHSSDSHTITGKTTFTGNVTASGDISASGTIFTDTISSPSNNLIVSSSTVTITSTTDNEANLILESDTDNNDENDNPFMSFKQDGGGIEGQIGISGDAAKWPDGTTLTGASQNSMIIGMPGIPTSTNRQLYLVAGNTASLEIKNDADVHIMNGDLHLDSTNALFGNGHLIAKFDSEIIIGAGNRPLELNSTTTEINGLPTFTGAITASSDISASGNIFGAKLDLNDGTEALINMYQAGTQRVKISGRAGQDSYFNAGDVAIGTDTPAEKLTVEGNISASGTISGQAGLTQHSITGTTDGEAKGDVVYFGGTTSMTTGAIYHYKSDGTWELADADAASTSDGLLAVALGAASDTNGMLLRGMVTLDHDPGAVGDVLYLSTTAGDATATAPSGNGDIVRIIGYCLDASNGQIWFNPDSTFVEVNA